MGKLCRGEVGRPVQGWPAGGRSSRAFRMEDAALGPRSTWSTYAAGSTRRAGLQHGCCGVVQRITMPPDTEACLDSLDPSGCLPGSPFDCNELSPPSPSLRLSVTRQASTANGGLCRTSLGDEGQTDTQSWSVFFSLGTCFGCLVCCAEEWTKGKSRHLPDEQKLQRRESKTEAEDGGSNRGSETSKNAVEAVENKHGQDTCEDRGSGIGDRRVLGYYFFRGLQGVCSVCSAGAVRGLWSEVCEVCVRTLARMMCQVYRAAGVWIGFKERPVKIRPGASAVTVSG